MTLSINAAFDGGFNQARRVAGGQIGSEQLLHLALCQSTQFRENRGGRIGPKGFQRQLQKSRKGWQTTSKGWRCDAAGV